MHKTFFLTSILLFFVLGFLASTSVESHLLETNKITGAYSKINNLHPERSTKEIENLIKLTKLQNHTMENEETTKKFIILNLINIGYTENEKIQANTVLIFGQIAENKKLRERIMYIDMGFMTILLFAGLSILLKMRKKLFLEAHNL